MKLVVDTTIARSAGTKDASNPVASAARDTLLQVRDTSSIYLVWTKDVAAEWNKHATLIAMQVVADLKSRGRLHHCKPMRHNALRKVIKEVDSGTELMLKDIFLVEAALETDDRIIALDDQARWHFAKLSDAFPLLQRVHWINPVRDDLRSWIAVGCISNEDCVPPGGVEARVFLEAVGQVRGAAGKASSLGCSVRSATLAAAM